MEHLFDTVKTSVELRHLGKSTSGVSRECARGELFKVAHNAYIKTALWESLSNTDRCLAGHVAFMKTNRGYVLSHVSAALWWGAPVLRLPHKIWVSHPRDSVKSRGRVQVSRNRQKECDSAVFHRGARVTPPPDFLWEKERVILEVDGKVKYAGTFGEAAEDVVQNERRRQHELESMGYTVVRALWEDIVVHPERLRAKLARAGVCEGPSCRM